MAKADSRDFPGPLPALIFSSRWLQLPLYLGLIVAHSVYVPLCETAAALDARVALEMAGSLAKGCSTVTDRLMGQGKAAAAAHR